jgi:sugar phosphate isomerase/epimerase
MEQLAALCEARGVRAVYQVHHGTLFPSPWSAYWLVSGLPAKAVGVMLDPGNQVFEGWENWHRSALLLGEYFVAAGIKDAGVYRDAARADEPQKGWHRRFVTLQEGVTDWHEFVAALKAVDFQGTFVWMPFYHQDDPQKMTQKLQAEVAYLRNAIAEVREEQ